MKNTTTILEPMCANMFAQYLDESTAWYASDLIAGFVATQENALEKIRSDIKRLLPNGHATPDNFLYEVRESKTGQAIGYFWYAMQVKAGKRIAFVCDIWIKPAFQRQGYATQVLTDFEATVNEMGILDIGLHVFGHNQKARSLYEKLGYAPTSIQMRKNLAKRS